MIFLGMNSLHGPVLKKSFFDQRNSIKMLVYQKNSFLERNYKRNCIFIKIRKKIFSRDCKRNLKLPSMQRHAISIHTGTPTNIYLKVINSTISLYVIRKQCGCFFFQERIQYFKLSNSYFIKSKEGTVVNRTFPSLQEGSLEKTL